MESGNGYYLYIGNISFIAQNVCVCINYVLEHFYVNIKQGPAYIHEKY